MNKHFVDIKQNIKRFCLIFMLCITGISVSVVAVADNYLLPELPTSQQPQIMVSLGDSYSSGEGIPPFYGQSSDISVKVGNDDWLAHRSQNSWPGRLHLTSFPGTMSNYRDTFWYFVAASGAETYHLNNSFKKDYDRSGNKGSKDLEPQLDVFKKIGSGNTDYVTLTLGGNDAKFSEVVTSAFINSYVNFGGLANKLGEVWNDFYSEGGIRDKLRQSYRDIESAAGNQAQIIVAGYPQLIAPKDGVAISVDNANLINDSVSRFNKEIENIVTSCRATGMKISFVPVEDAFKGHEAYADDPYINEIFFGTRSEDLKEIAISSAYSIHPNEKGAQAYADCVQKKIDELEQTDGESDLPIRTTSDERDIVLVLDVSGSMAGKPIEETKKAATNFIHTILQEDASIGIVTYDSSANMLSDFSVDEQSLNAAANNINDGGSTNMEDGLAKAEEMLSQSTAKKKIIVLMSDGEPNAGKVGDELISYADSIKDEGTYIYTLGFFENMGNGKSDAQVLMEKIASDGCHYEVANADDLRFFFGDIADQINGQKYIYVRIACPVDVEVTYKGETLSSVADAEKTRTSFGSLTFEENSNQESDGIDNRIKVLRLKDDSEYDVQINGNGNGKMNYTIGFMDENGEYSDIRKFSNIDISPRTKVDTLAGNASSTVLKVDSDGDGKYDLKYKAKANESAKIVDYTYIIYIVCGVAGLIALLIIYIKLKKWKRKSEENKKRKKAMQKKFCTNCGNEMPGDKLYCSKCGKKLE